MRKLSFSAFCESLGCPLKNIRWSWSAIAPDASRVLFTIWEDELFDGRFVLYPPADRRPGEIPEQSNCKCGAREIERIAIYAVEHPDVPAYGVICLAKDPRVRPRKRKSFDSEWLVQLRVVSEGAGYVAYSMKDVPAERLTASRS